MLQQILAERENAPGNRGVFFVVPISIVVPAHSGTHSHRALFEPRWLSSVPTSSAYGSRPKAGTTANYSSPCTFGISCVGRMADAAGAGASGACATAGAGAAACAVACISAGFGWAAATGGVTAACRAAAGAAVCCAGAGAVAAAGAGTGFAASGLGFGTGTVRLATCGIEAGGLGAARLTVGGGKTSCGP